MLGSSIDEGAPCSDTYNFDVSAANHDTIHLFQSQLCSLWNVVLNKCKSFMFLCNWIPRHVNGLNRTKWKKGLSYCIFLQLKTDAANVNSER